MERITLIVCFILNLVVSDEAAKILAVFPLPSISHQVVFRPLTQELARRGHQVVVITPDPAFPKGQTPANLTEIDVHELSYSAWNDKFLKVTSSGRKDDLHNQITTGLELITHVVMAQIQNAEVKEIIGSKNGNFDLLLLEAMATPALALSHILKVPVIHVSSLGATFDNYESMGVPGHPLLYPNLFRQRITNLTFWEKINELYNHYIFRKKLNHFDDYVNKILKINFGPDMPSMCDLKNNIDMLFLNIHPIWEGNFPVPPSVVYMGGMHQKPEKELPNDLKSYLDSSIRGVIYISFGTNVIPSMLPRERIQTLVNVFSRLPYDVLWKWDKDELPGQSNNIRISKWLPQSDLLRHPKVKLFITQGGLQSTDEAITAGVPLIGMPMIGDQWYNVEKYVEHKIGLRVDLETLTEEKFENAINTVIEDESYHNNLARLRELMRDQPQLPLERAVWWTEYVLRHGGAKHLRAPAANITWTEYLELEFISILLLGLLTIITLVLISVYLLWKFVSRKFVSNKRLKNE